MKTVFVTGATRGAGHAIATALAANGWRVYALGRDWRALEKLRAEHGITPLAVDVTDRDELRSVTADLRVDALVNAALRWPENKPFQDCDESEVDMAMEINLSAALQLTRSILPSMVADRQGAVVFVMPAVAPERSVLQATTSGALNSFSQALAMELEGSGVSVECISAPQSKFDNMAKRAATLLDARINDQHSGCVSTGSTISS